MSQSTSTIPQVPNTTSNTTKVVVATTVALTFITFWQAAAVVLNDPLGVLLQLAPGDVAAFAKTDVSQQREGPHRHHVAQITGAPRAFSEGETGAIASAARNAVGRAGTRTHIDAYARIALAPWFVLGCILPLSFLLWRRNL